MVNFVSIVIDALKNLKRSIISWIKLRLPTRWKSFLSHMHPNSFTGLKDHFLAPFISLGCIVLVPLINMLTNTLKEFLHRLCFSMSN